MSDEGKSEAQLSEELERLRRRIVELEREREQTRDRNETILRTCSDGFWLINQDGRILEVNDAYCRMSGYTRDELLTMSVQDLEAVETAEDVARHIREIMARGTHRFESRQRRKDGTIMDLDISTHRLRSDAGNVFTFMRDVTERKKAEAALAQSEEKYRTLVESSRDCIFVMDASGVFLYANQSTAEAVGVELQDLVGKTMWDFYPNGVADRRMAAIRQVIDTQRATSIVRLTEVRGQLCWYHTKLLPIPGHRGQTVVMGVARDIHDMKQAEEQIRTLISAVEQSIDGVAISDAKSRLLYVNEAFARMHGYRSQEMIGMDASDLYAQDQKGGYEEIFAQIRRDGSFAGQTWHLRKGGTAFPCYLTVTLVKSDRAAVTGSVAVCRDMTETRRKEEELNQYRAQMSRAEQLASLGTLSATVAHQITQPLTVIRLSLDNAIDELEASSCPHKVVRKLRDSVTQVSNITAIINRFRNFARQSSDTWSGHVSVSTIAVRVVRLLYESARQAGVTLRLKGMGRLPPTSMSEGDLEQLFFALLENGIQAAGGAQARQIVISGALQQGQIELRFSDTCGGIAPENRDRVFEPFFTTKPRGQGTGLGLCIVQDVVTRVGGRIRLESEPGKGTTFFVTLPVDKEATS